MSVTEIGCMGVKPNLSIMDPSTPEGDILASTWKTIMSLPGGPSRVYWGVETLSPGVETSSSPPKLWALFDWASVEEHEAFAAAHGATAVQNLPLILTHGEFTKHVTPTPFPAQALRSAMTELLLLYFPASIDAERQSGVNASVQAVLEFQGPEVEALSVGWGIEKDFPVRGGKDGKGEVGALCVVFVGWKGMEGRSVGWGDAIARVRGVEGLVGFEVVRLKCETMGKGGEERSGDKRVVSC